MKRRNYIIISAVLVSILASMIFTKEISALTVNEKTLIGKPTLLYTKRYFQRFDHIKLQDDYIYYTNTDKQLIRTNLDGTDKKIIVAHEISSYTMGFGGGKLDGVYKIDENFNAIEFSPLKRNYSFVGKTASKKFYKKMEQYLFQFV